jgi:hypothetical protein
VIESWPVLGPWENIVWDAYGWLLTFATIADGHASIDATALEQYFRNESPGEFFDDYERRFIRRMIPVLIRADRKITADEFEKARKK